MSATKEFTFSEVSAHTTKKDLYMVIHDKVYDTSSFVDEHPGGEEVLLDVGGQDATEAFEDVGHSDEAREILDNLLVGDLKRLPLHIQLLSTHMFETPANEENQDSDPKPKSASQQVTESRSSSSSTGGLGMGAWIVMFIVLAGGYYAYSMMNPEEKK